MAKAKRKYIDTFPDYGRTFIERGDEQLPHCVICFKTLSNASMNAYQLKQHLSNTHPQFTDKNRRFFEMKAFSFKKMKLDSAGQFQTHSNAVVTVFYAVSFQVAKTKKPHNIPEMLIKPCLAECAGILLGEGENSKVEQVSLCNVTVKSRIADTACYIKSQLIENIKASPVFGLLLDESVDSANSSHVRYIQNKTIKEGFLPPIGNNHKGCAKACGRLFYSRKIGINLEVFAQMGHLLCSGCDHAFWHLSYRKILK